MIGLDNEGRLNDWDLCRCVDVCKSLEGPRTVGGYLHATALVFTSIYRERGSSCLPDYSRIPDRSTR